MSYDPGCQAPSGVIDDWASDEKIGADEEGIPRVPMERPCPVCGGNTMYPSYGDMMRHWRREHHNSMPRGASDGTSGRSIYVPAYINEVIQRQIEHEEEETMDGWLRIEAAHSSEAASLWLVLGLRVEENRGSHAA